MQTPCPPRSTCSLRQCTLPPRFCRRANHPQHHIGVETLRHVPPQRHYALCYFSSCMWHPSLAALLHCSDTRGHLPGATGPARRTQRRIHKSPSIADGGLRGHVPARPDAPRLRRLPAPRLRADGDAHCSAQYSGRRKPSGFMSFFGIGAAIAFPIALVFCARVVGFKYLSCVTRASP